MMGHRRILLCFAVILISSLAGALFEEQAGEYDWKIESIGVIEQSFVQDNKTFVATADSVIASLDSFTGSLNWRATLPAGTFVHNIISGRTPSGSTDIFTLTSVKSASNNLKSDRRRFLLSSWSSEMGHLKWQLSLGTKQLGLTDLVYDSSRYLVTSLSGNTIDAATVRGHLIWNWNPNVNQSTLSEPASKDELTITQLILQVKAPVSNTEPTPTRIAIGCYKSKNEVEVLYPSSPASQIYFASQGQQGAAARCGQAAVISVILPSKLVAQSGNALVPNFSIKTFESLPEVSVASLRAAISSDDSVAYSASDVIFGISTSTKNKPTVSSLNLFSNAVTSHDVPASAVTTAISGASLIMLNAQDELIPTVVFCNEVSCSTFFLSASDSQPSKSDLNMLSECAGAGSILGVERASSGGSIARSISCAKKAPLKAPESSTQSVSVTGDADADDGMCVSAFSCSADDASTAVVLTVTSSTVTAKKATQTTLSALLPDNIVPSSLIFTSAHQQVQGKSAKTCALIVYSSLLTTLYCAPTASFFIPAEEQWRREESLSRVQHVLIVEDARGKVHKEGEDEVAPTLSERIDMQLEELKQTYNDLKDSLASLPEVLYGHAVTGFGMMPAAPLPSHTLQASSESGQGTDSVAGTRRRKLNMDTHREREKKDLLFGFNKIAVCLSTGLSKIEEGNTGNTGPLARKSTVGFSSAGLKVMGLDLLKGAVIWTVEPTLESGRVLSSASKECELKGKEEKEGDCSAVAFTRLVKMHSNPQGAEVTLLVSLVSGASYAWHLDASTGRVIPPHSETPGPNTAFKGPLVGVLSVEKKNEDGMKGDLQYILLQSGEGKLSASTYPPVSSPKQPTHNVSAAHAHTLAGTYAHELDRESGWLSTYMISDDDTGIPVSSARFPGPLAAVSYPSFDDVIDTRYTVIGDRSILMKYVNPHTVLLAYFSSKKTPAETGTGANASAETSSSEGSPLYAAVVDTVSSKILYRVLLCSTASAPVHALLVENHVIVTYWNAKAKRTELSSTALYEGMVDVFGLSPLSYFAALPQQIRDANLSSFTSPIPLGIQRTYVIPRMVTSLHHTITSRGMAHKNVLIGLSGGQLYSLDHRMIHPRRPVGPPTTGDKEEGLAQYNPFIPIIPQHAVTLDNRIAGEALHVATSSVRLESTSLVLIYGGLDVFFSRISPSQGFDVLASDFNHPLLIFLLLVLALGVLALKRIHVTKTLKQSWA